MLLTVRRVEQVDATYLRASCGVRYWEDAVVDGIEDVEGNLIPLRDGDRWEVTVALEDGVVRGWPAGTVAKVHYKVCDDGVYELLDADLRVLHRWEGYVPEVLSPGGGGYGDYVILRIDEVGRIADWRFGASELDALGAPS